MPTLASSSRAQLRYMKESSFGEFATSAVGAFTSRRKLRMTGETLDFSLQFETSKEIRADRVTTDLLAVGASATGGFNFELSYREYDELIAAVLQEAWSVYGTNGVGTTFEAAFDAAAKTITATTAPTGTSAFTKLVKGQWFRLTAPGSQNDGKLLQVSTTVAPTSTVITLASSVVAGTAVAGCKVSASRLKNGVTQDSYSLEVESSDISQFMSYRGMVASKLSMSFAAGAIVTGSFDFMGKDGARQDSSSLLAPDASGWPSEYEVMNAVSGVGNVMEGGEALTGTFIKSLKFDYDNSLRGQTAIGVLGNAGIGSGTIKLTGEIEVYFTDGTMYDKFINQMTSSLAFSVQDQDGNGYMLTFPAVEFSGGKADASAIDQDVMLVMPFTAKLDTATGSMMLIDRFGAAV